MKKSNYTILIAEDELEIARFLKQGLTEEGYNVHLCQKRS